MRERQATRDGCVTDPEPGVDSGRATVRNVRSKCRCSCVLQFTFRHAVSCVLHRPPSQVIHCIVSCFLGSSSVKSRGENMTVRHPFTGGKHRKQLRLGRRIFKRLGPRSVSPRGDLLLLLRTNKRTEGEEEEALSTEHRTHNTRADAGHRGTSTAPRAGRRHRSPQAGRRPLGKARPRPNAGRHHAPLPEIRRLSLSISTRKRRDAR